MRFRALSAVLALFVLAACNDGTAPTAGGPTASRRIIAPSGTLDQNIDELLGLFPKGLANAGRNRWGNIKAKYADGLTKPSQMQVARKMLFELAAWVQEKAPEMSPPPNDETRSAAAARLVLYMSQYVYDGPGATPPVFTPGADNVVGLVSPNRGATVVTPAKMAGVELSAGSVATETIVIITENPTPYPANCSGPLQTRLCQYPKFYHFNQFPHVRLLKAAKFAVCHVNDKGERSPLADHDRFRLAHTRPENPADQHPKGQVVDNIEILPLIHQTFAMCDHVHYQDHAMAPGLRGVVTRLAAGVGKLLTPKSAYAIDQGGGGEAFSFSDFNNVDPAGTPDNAVAVAAPSPVEQVYPGGTVSVTYTVTNVGTATSPNVLANIELTPVEFRETPPTITLTAAGVMSLVPRQTITLTTTAVIPENTQPGEYTLAVALGSNKSFPDGQLENNRGSKTIQVVFPPDVILRKGGTRR